MNLRRRLCRNINKAKERKQYMLMKSNTNSSQWGQQVAPAPQHTQNDTDSLAGDLSY